MAPHHSRPRADAQRHVHHRDEVVLTGAAPGPNCALSVVAAITWRTGRAACSRPAGLRSILLGHRAKPDSACRSDAADRPHEKAADRTTIALPYRRRYSRGEATTATNVTHMDILQRLVREPLVHFLGIGALVFALHGAGETVPAMPAETAITVAPAQVERLTEQFEATWRRRRRRRSLRRSSRTGCARRSTTARRWRSGLTGTTR
jgi:hypothetical protein